ncbi:MAG: AFG1/ZapE family ATPase, partial [Rhodocyclaceae bacterium]|nr:AFG1/ZapE family ATPase [Rhodocyclaceae bacterium]
AGLGDPAQFQRDISHRVYIDHAIRARDGAAPEAAFVAHDVGEQPIAPGDLLCNSRGGVDYRSVGDRRADMGEYAPAHCDVVVRVDADRINVIGGNVVQGVSLTILPLICDGEGHARPIRVLDRDVPVIHRAPGVIWFDFATLCGGPRSQNDYLELAHGFHTVFLSKVPRMDAAMSSEARRFTWLVDVFYDHRVKLVIAADCAAEQLYTEGTQAVEFQRTVSRLIEMRSHEYLSSAHRRFETHDRT